MFLMITKWVTYCVFSGLKELLCVLLWFGWFPDDTIISVFFNQVWCFWRFVRMSWFQVCLSCSSLFPIDLNAFLMIPTWVVRLCCLVSWRISVFIVILMISSWFYVWSVFLLICEYFICMIVFRVLFVLQFVLVDFNMFLMITKWVVRLMCLVRWRRSYVFYRDCDFLGRF